MIPGKPTRPASRSTLRRGLLCAVLAFGCGGSPEHPEARWQPGALVSGRTETLRRVLEQIERVEGTPLARAARDLREALPDCPEIEAAARTTAELQSQLRCASHDSPLAGLHQYRGDTALVAALPIGPPHKPRLVVRVEEHGQDLHVSLRWPGAVANPALAALLPGAAPAGPAVLGENERLLHARVRGDGVLDLAALVPEGSQGDQLFRLRGDLLTAAILDGTWEIALYLPAPGAQMPGMAVAFGVRLEAAAAAAAERLLDEVEAQWPVRRAPVRLHGHRGSCLLELNLLPELAPCYVTTERAIVLAWNPASLQRALDATASTELETPPGRVELDLARLREADLRLAERFEAESIAGVSHWPWQRILAEGRQLDDGALSLELAFEIGPEASGS